MSAPEDVYERIENRLVSHGVYVTEMDRGDDHLALTYETIHDDAGVPRGSIGRVVNVLRDLQPEGWDPVAVEATVTDLEGNTLGSWRAEAAWFHALADGDLTETAFSQRVLETVERPDQ